MKKTNLSLRHVSALGLLLVGAFAFWGCAQQPTPDPSDGEEDVAEAEEGIADCCSDGYYRCASNGYIVDYDQPGCGLYTKLQASNVCKSHCNNVACVDSGWRNHC